MSEVLAVNEVEAAEVFEANVQAPVVTLSPPWYTLRNEINATIGKTPCVKVSELVADPTGSNYVLSITVISCIQQAEAIRIILPLVYTFGGVTVTTEVYFMNQLVTMPNLAITTPLQVLEIITSALWCNPLFKGVVLTDGLIPPIEQGTVGSVVVLIKPVVIQFFDDDISNLCNNYINVASNVFGEVMNLSYGTTPIIVSVTTYDPTCVTCEQIICGCDCNQA